MVAHTCQPVSKDQAQHIDTTTMRCVVVVVSVLCARSLDEGWHLCATVVQEQNASLPYPR